MRRLLIALALASVTCTRCDVSRGAEALVGADGAIIEIRPDRSWWSPAEKPRVITIKDTALDARCKAANSTSGKIAFPYVNGVNKVICRTNKLGRVVFRTNVVARVDTFRVADFKKAVTESADATLTTNSTAFCKGSWTNWAAALADAALPADAK